MQEELRKVKTSVTTFSAILKSFKDSRELSDLDFTHISNEIQRLNPDFQNTLNEHRSEVDRQFVQVHRAIRENMVVDFSAVQDIIPQIRDCFDTVNSTIQDLRMDFSQVSVAIRKEVIDHVQISLAENRSMRWINNLLDALGQKTIRNGSGQDDHSND